MGESAKVRGLLGMRKADGLRIRGDGLAAVQQRKAQQERVALQSRLKNLKRQRGGADHLV